jgi:lipopolysaccharide/colanic/teichoic acid biosynthesis glycosyltransferase
MTLAADDLLVTPALAAPPAPSTAAAAAQAATGGLPSANGNARTIWGLDPVQLHTRFWAAHGVQVVRQGEPSEIVRHAELYLLIENDALSLFKLAPLMEALNWVKPQVLFVRLHDSRERQYREHVVLDDAGKFVKFQRVYDAASRMTRVALTPDRDVAQLWQSAANPLVGWRRLRRFVPRHDRATRSIPGNVYDRHNDREVAWFVHDLMGVWKRPDSTVGRARLDGGQVFVDPKSVVHPGSRFIGPVWVGAGREVKTGSTVVGPAVVWDDPSVRPATEAIQWLDILPAEIPPEPSEPVSVGSPIDLFFKRTFDICFSLAGILATIWLYPLVMIAIWFEDGRPFFFGHKRETLGGREFFCWKFRSMRKDAEKIKAELTKLNQADGPQFFIENDPRLTRVGRFLRKYNLDEFPQFWNVLVGDMSVVGPRPSPHHENQFCPAWREARLSVRPGITGLWQIKRTRRRGNDFQEWIKYDIEYVETRSWRLDFYIIWKTVSTIFGKVSKT